MATIACQSSEHFRLKQNKSGSWQVNEFHSLPRDTPPGLSGLSSISKRQLFAVAERNKSLLQIRKMEISAKPEILAIQVPQIPNGLDLEAVATLTGTSAWVGTEAKAAHRKGDALFKISWKDSTAKITAELKMPYKQFSRMPEDANRSNRGIEGICISGNNLIVATELPLLLNEQRLAAFSIYSFESKTWTPFYAPLLSKTGKISGISCLVNKNTKEHTILAIERHYEVAQIVRIVVPQELKKEETLSAERIVDLSVLFTKIPNLEGIVAHSEKSITLISDNQSATVRGRAVLVTLDRID